MEVPLVVTGLLMLASILASKVADRFGVPVLLLFLGIGMLAGSEGPGGIHFDNAAQAQLLGTVALIFILHSGGLDTSWTAIRPVLWEGAVLATLGVLLTALLVGVFAHLALGLPLPVGLLLGATISSTDAPAVFAILRARGSSLRGVLRPLLEFESGSNDPMAVFLTITAIQFIQQPEAGVAAFAIGFVQQMVLGGALGYVFGRLAVALVNRVRLSYDGLYPVLTVALVLLIYGLTTWLRGNGFLAVYVAGLVIGNHEVVHRRSLLRFHDGVAWLMQIVMFLVLGLLVFPSRLIQVAVPSLLVAVFLMLVARPASVFALLLPSRLKLNEKLCVAWVGLRGAVPIILGTYPLLAGVANAEAIFNTVFFVVITSVLVQGASLPQVARWLGVDAPEAAQHQSPLEYNDVIGGSTVLREVTLPPRSPAAGKAIYELGLPADFLIVLVGRGDEYIVPTGATRLQAGDRLTVITHADQIDEVQARLMPAATTP